MTVERGVDWGSSGEAPEDLVVVRTDAEARAAIAAAPGGERAVLAEPLRIATLDGVAHVFVAHLVARRSWWRGRVVAVMNAQFLGPWDIAPRAHPGDGRLDVLDADLTLGDRWKARSRLPAGTHVPHPAIQQTRTSAWMASFAQPTPIRLDGELVGGCRELTVTVEPDSLDVVV